MNFEGGKNLKPNTQIRYIICLSQVSYLCAQHFGIKIAV